MVSLHARILLHYYGFTVLLQPAGTHCILAKLALHYYAFTACYCWPDYHCTTRFHCVLTVDYHCAWFTVF